MNWPVETNYLEAKAFCNWKMHHTGKHIRLMVEAEWCVLRNELPLDQPQWAEAPGNINLEHYASSCPVNHFATKISKDTAGNRQQWCHTMQQ